MAFAHVVDLNSTTTVNNTINSAYQLTENTVEDSLSSTPKILWNCYLSNSNDTDWYQVFLSAGTKTLTINSANNNIIADVISSDGSTIISKSIHGPSTKQQKKFEVSTSGTYYIKISSTESFSTRSDYSIFIGAPWYLTGSYTQSLNTNLTVTPYNKVSRTVNFDLSNNTSIPNSAVVRKITVSGTETNKYYVDNKVRSIRPYSQYSWIDIPGVSLFYTNVLNPSSPISLKQNWSFKHSVSGFSSGYTSYSLNPTITFNYMYEADN